MPSAEARETNLHASAVAVDGHAALFFGASGTGKSALCLQMIALGARLISDDRTHIRLHGGRPYAHAPAPIKGLIEARGVGLLRVDPAPPAPITLIVDLDQIETERLPPERSRDLLGQKVPLLHRVEGLHFAPALMLTLRGGRIPQ